MSKVRRVLEKGLINKKSAPRHFPDSIQYETIMGSVAYGVSDDNSDMDVYGFCIPEKHVIFPHLAGHIPGFGQQPERFDQWMVHHVKDEEKNTEYDFTIYNIVKYFGLVMENNPNMVDSLFTPQNAILHCSPIAQMVRDERHIFLHKGSWHKFKGYAYSQMHKIRSKEEPQGKRKELVDRFGYDVKFAYHVVRLIDECDQILNEETLDLQRNREKLKAIRRGEWKLEDIEEYFTRREKELEAAYAKSKLPHSPDEKKIRQLLMNCLEHHYGNLTECVVNVDSATLALQKIALLIKDSGY
jgi:predicted nucleotidyltransferase